MFMRGQEGAVRGWADLVRGTRWQKPTVGQRLAGFGGTGMSGIEDLLVWAESQKSRKRMEEFWEELWGKLKGGELAGGGQGNVLG